MKFVRLSKQRGWADHGWLKSAHTFSFADYHDPEFMGFSVLRVINEDRVQGGTGFSTHGHQDMEIITVVLKGELAHKDTLGTSSVIRPGEVQRMSAGRGIRHSEFNHSKTEECHLYQIWILPNKLGLNPEYEQKSFAASLAVDPWVLVVSEDGRQGSLKMNQDAELWIGQMTGNTKMKRDLNPQRKFWLQVTEGEILVDDQKLTQGDAYACAEESVIDLGSTSGGRFLFFDLPL